MKEKLQEWGTIVVWVIIGSLWIGGCIHSCKKHKDDPVWLQQSPLAAYRGVEYFWHDDFADVNWNKRLANDLRTCVYFVNEGTAKEGNIYQVNEGIEEFSKKISEYPKDKKDYLKTGLMDYFKFNMFSSADLINSMDTYYETGILNLHNSQNTINYKDRLIQKYELGDIVGTSDSIINLMIDKANKDAKENHLNDDEIEKAKYNFKYQMEAANSKLKAKFKSIYKNIFNEEIKEQL